MRWSWTRLRTAAPSPAQGCRVQRLRTQGKRGTLVHQGASARFSRRLPQGCVSTERDFVLKICAQQCYQTELRRLT